MDSELNLNETHDPSRKSWVFSANDAQTPFPIQNLPFCVFKCENNDRVGVAIGDQILDLFEANRSRFFKDDALVAADSLSSGCLNPLMQLPLKYSNALRFQISQILKADSSEILAAKDKLILRSISDTTLSLPAKIGDYTDFLTSEHHTERHGKFKGLVDPLPAAFKSLPIAYHGRASSIVISGHPVLRPWGQFKNEKNEVIFAPAKMMDFELEIAAFIGQGNSLGTPISIDNAHLHLFGWCLLNDWSAKSIQWWESVLGPFLGKSFQTTISPWVITEEALRPFRTKAPQRKISDPELLPYLNGQWDQCFGGFDIDVEAYIRSSIQREKKEDYQLITKSNLLNLYWTFGQMVAHHTSNGCNLRSGDLIGSGTISGSADSSRACITEITEAGKNPLLLSSGEVRTALENGDEIKISAWAKKRGFVSIGFGECVGQLLDSTFNSSLV